MSQKGIILIRGLARNSLHWMDFPEYLKDEISHIRFYELPGLGTRLQEEFPLEISSLENDFKKFYQELPKDIDWTPVGISLGGMVVMDLLSKNIIPKGIIINSSIADCSIIKRVTPKALKVLGEAFIMGDIVKREEKIFSITSSQELDSQVISRWVDIHHQYETKRETVIRQLKAASTFKLPSIENPLLILCSRKDELCHFDCSGHIYDHTPNSIIHIHPDSGHDLPLDAPDWVAKKIKKFIK